jgi:hypothetical protein
MVANRLFCFIQPLSSACKQTIRPAPEMLFIKRFSATGMECAAIDVLLFSASSIKKMKGAAC